VHRTPLLALIALAAAVAGCGDDGPKSGGGGPSPVATGSTPTAKRPTSGKQSARPLRVRRAHCPAGAANCAEATGRVIYVEAKDPDGDGDLHLVVAGGDVTFKGVTVFDIEKELRPKLTPHIGDLASAAGPVYRGSYGQRQIQATELHVAYR
jgi:hypothetical protein